ncbi:hypothetical protein J6Q66_00155 [bacterium]|nr:hypothetical protein [bacterium]
MKKKLSIAFVWHMHQPMYKVSAESDYLMPWVRMHAIKDYLDMLLIMNKYPKLKLNFNLVPLLLSMLKDYQNHDTHDIHSRLTVKDVNELTIQEKEFILNNFFDANYNNMILHHEPYCKLYQKRYLSQNISVDDFSLQEYSDIMMWFNLAWFDPYWKQEYPRLIDFAQKESGYTLEDRIELIGIQREIISRIIPSYKKFQDEGRIEISTSPYFHPILPILLDVNDANNPMNKFPLPKGNFDFEEDAQHQVIEALNMCEELFGKRPDGIWPSEHCISEKTLNMLADCGVKWAISDEGVLSNSLGTEFVRDFKGNLEIPYDLCHTYQFGEKNINVIFRDAVIPNIIGFEYPRHNQEQSANDLYERIKTIQNKLITSPDNNHLLTIAIDGENCWENFAEDGEIFLNALYSLLENDNTLETVTVSEYLDKATVKKELKNVAAGSWINRNFSLWIAEPTKNLAWTYLCEAKEAFNEFSKEFADNPELIQKAQFELYIAESSDWFWWYGEPNDSGQDYIFDYLFRSHLKNIYTTFGKAAPSTLDVPLAAFLGKPSRYPKANISPTIDGMDDDTDNWTNAGCIELPSGPVLSENKFFNKIYFGSDAKNLYFRFDINLVAFQNASAKGRLHNLFIYLKTENSEMNYSHIRTPLYSDIIYPIAKELFDYELCFPFYKEVSMPFLFSKASSDGLWVLKNDATVKAKVKNIIEISIPFDDLGVAYNQKVDFIIINSVQGGMEEFIPQDTLLSIYRTI